MQKIGLTGNMGSGKSTVASIFSCLQVPVYHADEEAKKMYLREDVLNDAVSLAGTQILNSDGSLNRLALAETAFSDPQLLNALSTLIHPLVLQHFREWTRQHRESSYLIHEAAIIFESGYREEYDKVITVSCPEEIAIKRIEKRDNFSIEMIRQRMQFQLPDDEKASLSDFVILNDGRTLLIPQVLQIHKTLSERTT